VWAAISGRHFEPVLAATSGLFRGGRSRESVVDHVGVRGVRIDVLAHEGTDDSHPLALGPDVIERAAEVWVNTIRGPSNSYSKVPAISSPTMAS
jgi:hypothetical protein